MNFLGFRRHLRQVAGTIPIRDNQVLIMSSHRNPGIWVIPKGGCDMGETPEESAVRETIEEAGIRGDIVDKVGEFEFQPPCLYCGEKWYVYTLKFKSQDKEYLERGTREYKWLNIDDAIKICNCEEIRQVLEKAKPLISKIK